MKYENNNYPLMGFGQRLKQARKDAGYSQKGLAEKVKISRKLLYRYENDMHKANFTVAAKLAVILNVSLDWLAYGKESDKKDDKDNSED